MWQSALIVVLCAVALLWLRITSSRRIRAAEKRVAALEAEAAALRRQHEQEFARRESHESALLESAIEGVLVLDTGGRVQTVNSSFKRLFGIEREIRGFTLMEALRSPELAALLQRLAKEGEVRGFEFQVPGIQRARHFEVNAAKIRGEGGWSGAVLVFHDFTRIKELENIRREFVANVSHELRTPLTLIKGYVETLLDGASEDSAVANRFLQKIDKHAARLSFLIEDLLTLSQLDTGQLQMNRQPVALAPLAERVLEELEAAAGEKKIRLRNTIPADFHGSADPDRLQQVFYNLADNAIKYGRLDGNVLIRATRRDGEIEICIEDDGRGIPAEARERVFERFYRVDRARSREQGGTGLGLAIVKHIVQAHGGRAWVESEIEKGSRFYFTVPAEIPAQPV